MNIQKPSFNQNKATALATCFLQLAGGILNKMKLIKLMYLVDRTSFCEVGQFVTNDDFYSLHYGPFLSHTSDLMDHQQEETTVWNSYISAPQNYDVKLRRKSLEKIQAFLSDYEIELAERIYAQYGQIPKWKLVELLHKTLPEWEDPGEGNRKLIDLQSILASCGKTKEEQKEILLSLAEQAQVERFFS